MSASTWQTITWTVTRAGGFTAYILLTLAVALGLALSLRWQSQRWPRLLTNDLHRFLTLLALAFVAVHGLAAWLDPFMRFGWAELLVPLASHYRPLWMALGIVAGYLALAVWLSTELRPRIGYAWWRRLHGLAFAVYALATIHGLGTGSDTQAPWALGLYAGSVLLVGTLLGYRLLTPIGARGRTYPNLAGLLALLVVGGVVWTSLGPARAGWNAIANNGQGSGARGVQATGAATAGGAGSTSTGQTTTSAAFATSFSAGLQGTMSQSQPDASGAVTVRVAATLSGGAQGTLQVVLQGMLANDGSVAVTTGQVTLLGPGGTPRYQGTLQDLRSDGTDVRLSANLQGPSGQTLMVQSTLQILSDGQVSGVLQGNPAS